MTTNLFGSITSFILSHGKTVHQALLDGSDGQAFLALAGVALVPLVPLTLIRPIYCISVGYGAAVACMSLVLILVFQVYSSSTRHPLEVVLLVQAAFWYGVRLTAFLVWREVNVKGMSNNSAQFQIPATQLPVLVVMLAAMYACMTSPVLYVLRAGQEQHHVFIWIGVVLAWMGLIIEAVADQHKLQVKSRHEVAYGEKRFVGPTRGLYGWCRHPNFMGEILFWTGLWLSGFSTFGWIHWLCSTLGWICILFIMTGSAKRLDQKQEKRYGGQAVFEEWKRRVPGSLFPRF